MFSKPNKSIMKLIYCGNCGDVLSITTEEIRTCSCGHSSGMYTDNLNAWYKGEKCIPLGFNNGSFNRALANQPETDWGQEFSAFVIEKDCKTFKKI